jgi:3-keto-5-aminohexanoate cleavage enzyme
MEKMIITVAVTGSLTTKQQNPNLPYTPQEIAKSVVESWKAGASMVHLHVRDPLTGQAAQNVALFKETIGMIRQECDILVNVSTGGGPRMTAEERIGIIEPLAADPKYKPEMASLNCGSLNFGLLSRTKREFILNDVQQNPWGVMLHFADTMKQCGVKPELEIYEAGMVNNAMVLKSLDALKEPLHFSFVLGVLGAMQPTVENLVFLKNSIPGDASWSVCSVGLTIYTVAPVAIATGGHVRVGFEDCIHIAKGQLADSNAQMVAKMAHIAEQLGREIAKPAEARKILNLQGLRQG